MNCKRILLKLSGEALKGNQEIFQLDIVKKICKQIIELQKKKVEIAIVVGGGNIWRGRNSQKLQIEQNSADYIGMLGTVINGIFLQETLNNLSKDCATIQSKLEVKDLIDSFNYLKARKILESKKILILTGGTGSPFFTTDTSSVLKAIEIKADYILMAKNGVDGVYDSDPNINADAKFIKKITYNEIIDKKINIIDSTAAALANTSNIKTLVFDMNKNNAIYDIVINNNKIKHTIITK